MSVTIDVNRIIRRVFPKIEDNVISELENLITVRQVPENIYVCTEGKLERTFYIIADGEVKITKTRNTDKTQIILQSKSAGDFFGETGLLLNRPRTADVITSKPSVLLALEQEDCLQVIQHNPTFAFNLFQVMFDIMAKYNTNHQVMEKQYIIFTSYSRKDEEIVKQVVTRIKHDLDGESVYLWFDQVDIAPGKVWYETIEKALQKSSAMLLFLSSESIISRNVRAEYHVCLDEGKTIIPVMLNKCEIPMHLRPFQRVDFTKYRDPQEFDRVIQRIHASLLEIPQQVSH